MLRHQMFYQISKKRPILTAFLGVASFLFSLFRSTRTLVYAQFLANIADVIARILNVIVLSAAAIFLIMIFITAYKFAAAQGDPKGLAGAKQSLTYTIIGFIGVLGVYVILTILVALFGLDTNYGSVDYILEQLKDYLCGIGCLACISYPPDCVCVTCQRGQY